MASLTTSLPRALALAFAQLGDRAIRRVLVKSLALTLGIFALLAIALSAALARADGANSAYFVVLGTIVSILAAWLLFRIVALAVIQLFADEIVHAVEARHYPAAVASARDLGFRAELANGLRGAGRAVAFNAIAAPFAIVLLVTGVGTALLFFAVNAWLLGRELQDMVWLRHRPDAQAPQPLSGPTRFALGSAVAGLLLIPFVNLLAPVIGAAAATHLVHGARRA